LLLSFLVMHLELGSNGASKSRFPCSEMGIHCSSILSSIQAGATEEYHCSTSLIIQEKGYFSFELVLFFLGLGIISLSL
jgi:hypothetical protein